MSHESKKRFRHLLTTLTLRHNLTMATNRKLEGALEGLDLYGDIQKDEINYSFNELVKALTRRRDFLVSQVDDVVTQMKKNLHIDHGLITKKVEAEKALIAKVRHLNDFCFAVAEKVNKRVMCKWKPLCELERAFERLDKQW